MSDRLKDKIEILVFQEDHSGVVFIFHSIKEASDHFGVHRDTIMRKLVYGTRFRSYFFDWGFNTPADVIEELEERYTRRFLNNSRYGMEAYYKHVAQKKMQDTRMSR